MQLWHNSCLESTDTNSMFNTFICDRVSYYMINPYTSFSTLVVIMNAPKMSLYSFITKFCSRRLPGLIKVFAVLISFSVFIPTYGKELFIVQMLIYHARGRKGFS